jgi:hypothetical protein
MIQTPRGQTNQADMERNKQHLRIERKGPRVAASIDCVVGLPDGDLSAGQICNMSVGGLKFACGLHTLHSILPQHERTPGSVTGITVEIHFELQLPDQAPLPVKCNARMVHFERLAQDNFHVGLQFTSLDETTTKAIHTYLVSISKKPGS